MNRKVRLTLMVLLAAVFIGSLVMLFLRNQDYQAGEENYAEAEELVDLPDLSDLPTPGVEEPVPAEDGSEETEEKPVYVDPYADALRNMDFTALREVNSDVLGWIVIPGTAVSYPLLQGDDNQYYLKHTWKKWTSAVGAIFLECRNSGDLSDFNTVVYGHRMNNGSMFASLKYYKKQSYWSAHPCVYISDNNGSHKYEIFAAYEVSTEGNTYQIGFSGDASKQAFIDYCLDKSVIQTGITPTVYDRILTLSTCTGNGHATRWVVQAVLKGEAPAEKDVPASEPTEEVPAQEMMPESAAPTQESPAESAAEADGEVSETSEETSTAVDAEASGGEEISVDHEEGATERSEESTLDR